MNKEFKRISKYQDLISDLYGFCKKGLGFSDGIEIVIMSNKSNSLNPLGKTAFYDPSNLKIGLYTSGRHIKDILRSLAHELVHHSQNCRGDFDGGAPTVEGYAQKDEHLREMEREAYEKGNMLFRDWEDGLKKEGTLFTENPTEEKLMESKEKTEEQEAKKDEKQKFFPDGYKINQKAYNRLNDALMDRWGFKKEEK